MPETFSFEDAVQGETFSFEDALKEGPSEVVRAAVPGSLAPDQLLPAVRLIGGETVTGAQGDTHPDIIDKWGLPARDIDQRGFTGPFGFFYDRESAAQALRAPTVFEPGRLHSTDLSTLQEPGGAAKQLREAAAQETPEPVIPPTFETPVRITEQGPEYQSALDDLARWVRPQPEPPPSLTPISAPGVQLGGLETLRAGAEPAYTIPPSERPGENPFERVLREYSQQVAADPTDTEIKLSDRDKSELSAYSRRQVSEMWDEMSSFWEGTPLSFIGFTPENIPSGKEISQQLGLPEFVTTPLSSVDKAIAGFLVFLTSPSGLTQIAAAGIPIVRPIMMAKWLGDMLAGGGESAQQFGEALGSGDYQAASDAFVNYVSTAAMVAGVPGVRIKGKRAKGLAEHTFEAVRDLAGKEPGPKPPFIPGTDFAEGGRALAGMRPRGAVPPPTVPEMPVPPKGPVPPKPIPGMPPEPTIPVPPNPAVEAARDWETELKKKEPGAPPPPNPEPPTVTEFNPSQVPTKEIPVERIVVNKDVPNFKEDADPKTGVVAGERLEAGKYQRVGVAPIVVWKKANGEMEIITGRHRLDLARRLGEKTIPAQIVEESKGFTKDMALTFDAESNIRDGQGSIQDYAHYFRLSEGLTEAEARQRGLLSRAKGKAGWDLAKAASDDLYAGWRAKKISDAKALAIARAAPGDAAKQQLGIKLAQEGKDADFIKARLERERAKTETPIQTDMFGNPVFDDAKADAEAARVVEIRKDLEARIRAGKNAARDPKAAAEMGIDVKDPAATLKQIEALQAELARWEGAWWLQPDLVEKVSGKAPGAPKPAPTPPPAPKAAKEPWQMTADEAVRVTGLTWDAWMDQVRNAERQGRLSSDSPVVKSADATGYQDWVKLKSQAQRIPQPLPPAPAPPSAPTVKRPFFDPEAQKIVDDLEARIRAKLGPKLPGEEPGPAFAGAPFDPEIFDLGAKLAYQYLKAGVRSFSDFATHMIARMGEVAKDYLLSWYNNARLQFKDIANELDSEATAERIYRERFGAKGVAPGQELSGDIRGGGAGGGRPGIRIARQELIPEPRQHVNADSYAARSNFRLDPEQVRGVNLVLDRFLAAPKGGFVLADGTGFGKTAQMLAIADQYIKSGLGKRVLVVTQNKQIVEMRFKGDAARMGIDPKTITLTTYTSLGKLPKQAWDLVIFDEAHNLKNAEAKKSVAAAQLDTKHTLFGTATPMDRPTGAAYFLAEITGQTEAKIAHDLGYTLVEREDPITHDTFQVPVLLPGFSWAKVWANIMLHRDAAIKAGAMIRREYPFYGDVNVRQMDMSFTDKTEHDSIVKHFDALIARVRNPTAKRNFAGQKTLELGRWSEQVKLGQAVDMAVQHIQKGGQVIIVCETDKAQSFSQPVRDSKKSYVTSKTTGRTKEVWVTDGAITKVKALLAEKGITDVSDIHDPKSHDIALQVRRFQDGKNRVAVATPQSGGTGIDLDDATGTRPRLMIALSKNMAGDAFDQLVGRVSRRDTKSPAEVVFLNLKGAFGDERRNAILDTKVRTLRAIQGGEDLDVAGGFTPGEPGTQLPGIQTAQRLDQPIPAGRAIQAMSATMFATTKTPADAAVWRILKRKHGLEPGGAIRVSFKPGEDWRARIRWHGNEPLYIEVNSGRFQRGRITSDLQHELAHWFDVANSDKVTVDIMRHVKPDELEGIIREVIDLGYKPEQYELEYRAEAIRRLAEQWRERPWFQRVVADVVSWAGKKLGYDMSRFDAELVAVRGIAAAMRAVKDIKIRNESVIEQARKSPELVAPEWAPAMRERLLQSMERLQFGEARKFEDASRMELEEMLRVPPTDWGEYMRGRGYGEEMRIRLAQTIRPEEVPSIEAEARRLGTEYSAARQVYSDTIDAFKAEHPDWELLREREDPSWVKMREAADAEFTKMQGIQAKQQTLHELLLDAPKQAESRFGDIVVPGVEHFWDRLREGALDLPAGIRNAWRSFSMQSLPRITDSNRLAGEAGVRYAASPMVARAKGMQFAADVTEGITMPDFDKKFGTALTEDNLRDLKRIFEEKSDEAYNRDEYIEQHRETIAELADDARDGDPEAVAAIKRARAEIRRLSKLTDEDGARFQADADAVVTTIGAENSPFRTESDYQGFMQTPEAQGALRRHIALWETEKDPLFRQANDLDPDLPLETRGVQFGARINLKNVLRDQGTPTTVGPAVRSPLIRATATLKRTDPFSRAAKGAGSYEGSYTEIMANGFGREYPVAKQHEFIRELIRSGDAVVLTKEFDPEVELKGESTKGYPLKLRPWVGKFLHIRRSMAPEYEDATGLSAARKFGIYTKAGELATRMSVQGLAEGSTHVSNLLTQVFTGLGPTGNPMLNALVKSAGRADVLYALPKILINAFANRKADMLKLAEIGAAKEPYRGGVGWFITKIDHGVRLYSAEVYKRMAEQGWVPDTETGLREYVNQVGQYNKRLQPRWIQDLRSTHIQPFATAMQTFNVQGLRTLAMSPGIRAGGAGRIVTIDTPTGRTTIERGGHSALVAGTALRAEKVANILGFISVVTALNMMVSGTPSGPPGTKLGAVGWIGDDKKVHQLDIGLLTGISRGARITGLQPFVEARRLGLPPGTATLAGAQGAGNTLISAGTGPINRAIWMGITGKRPSIPPVQEAQVMPPQEQDFSPMRTQVAANIKQAAQQSNPAVDFAVRMKQGKYTEAVQRQFSRYFPRTGMKTETIEKLPKIVEASELNAYVEALAKEARKLPAGAERAKFIRERMTEDGVSSQMQARAQLLMRRRGLLRH